MDHDDCHMPQGDDYSPASPSKSNQDYDFSSVVKKKSLLSNIKLKNASKNLLRSNK